MKINYRHKKIVLEQFYKKLEMIKKTEVDLSIPLEIKEANSGIMLSDSNKTNGLAIILKPGDNMAEVRVLVNGVKLFYSSRNIRMKKNTVEDLLKVFRTDERLNGCYNTLETYLALVLNVKDKTKERKIYSVS